MADLKDGELVLEPSAGIGLLAEGILKHNKNVQLHCVELNQQCREELIKNGFKLVGNDFFMFDPKIKYDCVIGAPNFRDNIDCEHVKKMFDCTKNGGRVVSIMSPHWMIGETKRQIEFRNWIKDKKYHIEMLPDYSYIENGKTVPTIIIRIEK